MPRYRMEFSKKNQARFLSHLDLMRTFERSVRRAGLPVSYTCGFNPHPRLSFSAPLPVGMAGYKEYLDIEMEKDVSPEEIIFKLNSVLPEGIKLNKTWQIPKDEPSLMAVIDKASYRVEITLLKNIPDAELKDHIQSFLMLPEINIKKKKVQNIRPGIYSMEGKIIGNKINIDMILQVGGTGNIRAHDVIKYFIEKFNLPVVREGISIIRTGLYPVRNI